MENSHNKAIGIVASGTTLNSMTFYATKSVQTDYVSVKNSNNKKMIFEVIREVAQNNRLTDADMARFIEYEDNDDYQHYNVYVCDTIPIVCLDKNGHSYQDAFAIAPPGAQVYQATAEELALAYDIVNDKDRIKIGTLLHQKQVDVCINLDQLLWKQAHLAVVGRTGSGKSWLVQHILPFLKMHYLIFSPTDEYNTISKTHIVKKKDDMILQFNRETAKHIFNLNASELKFFRQFIKDDMDNQPCDANELSDRMELFFKKSVQPKRNSYQISLPIENLIDEPLPHYAATLCQKIGDVEFRLQKTDTISSEEDQSSVVYDLNGCRRSEEELIIYSTLFNIYEERKKRFSSEHAAISPQEHILIVLEEAQNYAPSNRSTLCKDLLVDIARTGRKFGMHILLLSQRPRYIDQTILSQCGGGLFFNLPNPEDVDYVMSAASLERSASFKHMIQNFNTGECLLLRTEKSSHDLLCKISSFEKE